MVRCYGIAALAAALLLIGGGTSAQPSARTERSAKPAASARSTRASSRDRHWADMLAMGNNAEIRLGKLAARKATSPDVKQFAQRMVDDHTRAKQEAKDLVDRKGLKLPTGMDSRHRSLERQLMRLNGARFDRKYMQEQLKDHVATVNLLRRIQRSAKDPDFRAFAGKLLPTVQDHLQMARNIVQQGTAGGRRGTAPRTSTPR